MKKSEMRKIPGFKQIKRTEDKHIDYSDDEYDKKEQDKSQNLPARHSLPKVQNVKTRTLVSSLGLGAGIKVVRVVSDLSSRLGAERALKWTMHGIFEVLEARYPSLKGVLDMIKNIEEGPIQTLKNRVKDTSVNFKGKHVTDDGESRPDVLIVGLLFKFQEVEDLECRAITEISDVIVNDETDKSEILTVLGFYYCILCQVIDTLHSGFRDNFRDLQDSEPLYKEDIDELRFLLSQRCKLELKDVLYAHNKDSCDLSEHCPNFALVIIHAHRQVVLNICGTEIKSIQDIFMDLCSDSCVFLEGLAHKAMLQGARNIITMILDIILKALSDHPRYGLLIVGYSLGGAVASLLTQELLSKQRNTNCKQRDVPKDIMIRCITYGSPPTYSCPNNYTNPHIFSIKNHNDVATAAHLDAVTRLCEKISLIRCLQIPPRSMEHMLTNRSFFDNDDSDDPEIFDQEGERLEKAVYNGGMSGNWEKVKAAVRAVDEKDKHGVAVLRHVAKHYWVAKKHLQTGKITMKKYENGTDHISKDLRLRKRYMLSSHMSYHQLFEDFIPKSQYHNRHLYPVPIELFEKVLAVEDGL